MDVFDTGSNFDMVVNPDAIDPGSQEYLEKPFEYRANTGDRLLHDTCTVMGEQRYVDLHGITNIRSLSKAVKAGHRVTYDSLQDDAFFIYPKEGGGPPLVYRAHPQGLYV